MCTFVCCKTTSKTNKQCIRIDFIHQRNNTRRISLVLQPSVAELITDIINQFILQCDTSVPDFFIRNIIDSFPNLRIRLVFQEVFVEIFVIQFLPFRSTPSGEMYTIGNITYMIFFREVSFPNTSKHFLRNFSVQPAYTVYFLTCIACESRHTETFIRITRINTSQVHQIFP